MIAKNFRKFPEALLYQLELTFDQVLDTFEGVRVKGGAAWANLKARYQNARADIRSVKIIPAWAQEARTRAQQLAFFLKGRQEQFFTYQG